MGHLLKFVINILLLFICVSLKCTVIKAYKAPERALDAEEKYLLSWEVDDKQERVTFHASVQTTGYVGLGISPNGGMDGADIFIGGVHPDTGTYFSDRHGKRNVPEIDSQNDWTLLNATEENGWTKLSFSRLLNTCDPEDFPITEADTTRLIFSYGESDTVEYHGTNRGTTSVSVLGTEEDNVDLSRFESWKVSINMTVPNYDTSYWCTIHRREQFGGMRHVVGFDAFLENNTTAKKHTHHLILHKCHAPKGDTPEETFEKFVGHRGEECYKMEADYLPKHYCTEYMFIWATGGKMTLFPDDVGHPIEETEDESKYFMLEIHYDNPEELDDVTFETGIVVYYTDIHREKEAGLMTMAYDLGPTLTIPPNATDFVVVGHCSEHCTKLFPEEGINIYNILLHSHLSGKRMKVRHFRGTKELPWIQSDSSYDFNYQQNKALKQHVKILPGDHLVTECTYDSRWNGGSAIMGGFKTSEEMCSSHFWYYPRVKNIDFCASAWNLDQNFRDFGITDYTRSENPNGPVIINAPPEMSGLNYTDAITNHFEWTDEFRRKFQQERRFGVQEAICAVLADFPDYDGLTTKYPDYDREYAPEDTCATISTTTSEPNKNSANKFKNFATLVLAFFVLLCQNY